ncbi:MAG TPA: hypothetical protein VFA63_07395, partial [Pseudonocardiaceae bacterium]|nr:hypothetical protein [Pseudonocardiaceae bacterium]
MTTSVQQHCDPLNPEVVDALIVRVRGPVDGLTAPRVEREHPEHEPGVRSGRPRSFMASDRHFPGLRLGPWAHGSTVSLHLPESWSWLFRLAERAHRCGITIRLYSGTQDHSPAANTIPGALHR